MKALTAATYKVASKTADPMVAEPNEKVKIYVTLVDDAGALAPDVALTLQNVDGTSDIHDATTDASGVATFSDITLDDSGILTYEILSGTDVLGGVAARFCDDSVHAPTIPNAMTDHELDKYDIANGVQLVIPAYDGESVGDYVHYYWGSADDRAFTITALSDLPKTIDVGNDCLPTCLSNGSYTVFYEYMDHVGNTTVSKSWEVKVTGGNLPATLDAPSIPEAKDTGFINKKMAADGTVANIEYASLNTSDAIVLYWVVYDENKVVSNSTSYSYTTTATDKASGLVMITIPAGDIPAVQNGSASLMYTVTPVGSQMESSYTYTLLVDTVG